MRYTTQKCTLTHNTTIFVSCTGSYMCIELLENLKTQTSSPWKIIGLKRKFLTCDLAGSPLPLALKLAFTRSRRNLHNWYYCFVLNGILATLNLTPFLHNFFANSRNCRRQIPTSLRSVQWVDRLTDWLLACHKISGCRSCVELIVDRPK